MDFHIGMELLVQSPNDVWTPATIEEDEDNEIYIKYKEGTIKNEWIDKDSLRIKLMDKESSKKLIKVPSPSEHNISEVWSMIVPTKVQSSEKEIIKKSTNARSTSIFKVKFKKEDFLSKKTQDSKLKEQKTMKDVKKSSDREAKQLLSNNTSINENHSISSLKRVNLVETSEMESEIDVETVKSPKQESETNMLRSDNFEELLEDIEAEAKSCSPTKSISHSNVKQKKKRKKLSFGLPKRRRSEKKKILSKSNESKKKLVVKLNPHKVNTLTEKLNSTDDTAAASPPKKLKPSSSATENALHQNSPPIHQLANNSLLQKIRMDASHEQGFKCPINECQKLFRKENLLMMHIKHYHSEYTELLVSTPNVTDLATARIEGENVDELSPSYFLHRISQLEAKRGWANISYESPSPSIISSPLKFIEREPESNTSYQSENNTSLTSVDKMNNTTQAYDSKDSGFSAVVESVDSMNETPIKESFQLKEPIKKITLVENGTRDVYNKVNIIGSKRHFKIKKNKSDIESLPKEEVINCSCGSNQEDGLMIQCDVCLCWQHSYCNKIDSEDQVPEDYICTSCLNPSKKRHSKQYVYLQDWIKEGKVASVLSHKDERRRKDENILKQSHQLVAEVIEHTNFLHSLLVKTAIYGQTPDHPKLYLWSEQGLKKNEPPPDRLEELISGPVPEKPINTAECRKNLIDEIEDGFDNLEARINLFEAKTNGLEDQVNSNVDNEVLINTVTMLLRDLNSMKHYLSLENKNKESDNV